MMITVISKLMLMVGYFLIQMLLAKTTNNW